MNTMEKNINGFTLIELLVVIAIIGILATVIIGSISSAPAKAKRSAYLQEVRSSISGLVRQCSSDGAFPVPTTTDRVTWPLVWAMQSCGPTGSLNFRAVVSNTEPFGSVAVGGCQLTVTDQGIYIDANANAVFDAGEEVSNSDCL